MFLHYDILDKPFKTCTVFIADEGYLLRWFLWAHKKQIASPTVDNTTDGSGSVMPKENLKHSRDKWNARIFQVIGCLVLPGFTKFYLVIPSFYQVLLSYT